jgi:uncharacterized repeat protein (TIGR01451 family)
MKNKKASKSARKRLSLLLLVVLITGIGLVPTLGARAEGLSPSTLSAVGLAYRFAGGYKLLPSSMAIFAPQEDDPPTGADLSVTKTVNSENVPAGSDVTYTIEVRNNGPEPALNAILKDTLPAGMTFVSLSSPADWTCTTPSVGTGGDVTCSANNSLAVDSVSAFTLKANISSQQEPGTFFTNIATITEDTFDPNDENNAGSASTGVATTSADVSVTKSTASNTARADSDVAYTIEVRNNGPDAGSDVAFDDTLPGTMTFVSLTQNSGPTFSCTTPAAGSGGTIHCENASVPAGSIAVFTLTGHIPSDASDNTEYTNVATASTNTHDNNEENNSASVTTTVVSCDFELLVTTNADSGPGSLRQAILDVCNGGTISFAPSVVGFISLTTGELLLNKNLTISGPGADLLVVRRDPSGSTPNFRIFNVSPGANVRLSGLTINNGRVGSGQTGGGLNNISGAVTLANIFIVGNTADFGGGVYNGGAMTIRNSIINSNSTIGGGGAGLISTTSLGGSSNSLTIINSTISNNTVGGGIFIGSGPANIINSTISKNASLGGGGGLTTTAPSTVLVSSVTITGNRADSAGSSGGVGGGISKLGGSLTLNNSIVAGNYRGTGTTPDDIQGNIDSAGYNLIGDAGSSGGVPHDINGNRVGNGGSGTIDINTVLNTNLANNGGTTPTHALVKGSPALDAGSNALLPADTFDLDNDGDASEPLPVDQRGLPYLRVTDSADAAATQTVDVGSYEAQVSVENITDKATDEDTPLSFSFNVGDASLVTSVTATSSNTTLVPNANLSVTGAGSTRTLQITPASNLSGTTTITVVVSGDNAQSMTDTFVLTVTAVNDAPQAANDSYSTAENTALSVAAPGVLANDTDIDSATLTASLVSNAANGSVTLNANGSFVYTPNAGFAGTDSFTYKANDGSADSNVATVTITVNEGGTLKFSNATYSVGENDGNATITVTRTGGTAGTATVLFQTSNGTASSSDYTSVSQTVTFADGESSKTVSVPVTNDTTDEPDETVNLTLSSAGGSGQLGTPATAVLTIQDMDDPTRVSINSVVVNEGNSGTTDAVFTVKLSAASALTATVNFATADGEATAPSDYQSTSGTLTFSPGELSKTVTVKVNGDTVNEGGERFYVNLSNPQNAALEQGQSQGVGIIANDDQPVVRFSATSFTFSEGAGHGDVIVTRSGDLSQAASVEYLNTDFFAGSPCQQITGFASLKCDYVLSFGTLRFEPGEAQKVITVLLVDDAYVEGTEQFTITLMNPVGTFLGTSTDDYITAVNIADNDTQPATENPIDNTDFFIRQLYLDFLGRDPDQAGFDFWKARMTTNCPTGQTCDRIDTAFRFFSSDEFRERGYFVYLFYHAALGTRPGYSNWLSDVSKLNGFKTVAEQEAAKQAFINEFMSRQPFMNIYNGAQTGQTFVETLIQKSGVTPASKQTLIDNYDTVGRARTLRAFLETPEVQAAFVDRAFVTMLYFGFLRRDPEPDGFSFWMQKLNDTNHDYRFLIGGFMQSDEYRFRFAQIPAH